MMIDMLKKYSYGIGRLLRHDSRDMVFLFGDKVCSEGEGGRTVYYQDMLDICSTQRMVDGKDPLTLVRRWRQA